jgi:type IV pilus assembly protein PilA
MQRAARTFVTYEEPDMRHQVRPRIQSQESGFTLIELLVVVVIVALLAAIAIPAFLGQREKAEDSEAKVAVRTATSAAKDYFINHDDTYAGMDKADLQAVEPSLNQGQGATITVVANGTTGYTLTVTSKTRNDFTITEVDSVASRTCDTQGSAGCPTGGRW